MNKLVLDDGENSVSARLAFDYTFAHFFHDPAQRESRTLASDVIEDVLIDRSNVLWVATLKGLSRLDLNKAESIQAGRFERFVSMSEDEHSLATDECSALYESSDGALWVGTTEGVSRLDPRDRVSGRFENYRFPDEILVETVGWQRKVKDICSDQKGRLWLALNHGLVIFDPATHSFQHFRSRKDDPWSLSSDGLTAILRDRAHLIWIGTVGLGLNTYDPRKAAFQTFTGSAVSGPSSLEIRLDPFIQDSSGTFWFPLRNNLCIFEVDESTGVYQPHRVINVPVSHLLKDHVTVQVGKNL